MPDISVDTRVLRNRASSMRAGALVLGVCAATIDRTSRSLPFSDDLVYAINRAASASADSLSVTKARINRMADSITTAAQMYEQAENRRAMAGNFDYLVPVFNVIGGVGGALAGGVSGSAVSGSVSGAGTILGIGYGGSASGSLLNYNADGSVTYGLELDAHGNIQSLGVTAEGGASVNLAQGEASGNIGLLSGTISGQVGSVAVNGETGIVIFEEGHFVPSVFMGASASAAVLSGSANLLFGNDNNNLHVNAEGSVLSAEAYANGAAGVIRVEDENGNVSTQFGVQGKVGAEAYVAQGTLSGGFEIFGIEFNGSVTGSVGGVGASAGGSVTTGGVSGSLGLGLGAGGEVAFSVDWSGFDGAEAWDTLTSVGENVYEWASDVGEDVGDFFEGIGDSISDLFR